MRKIEIREYVKNRLVNKIKSVGDKVFVARTLVSDSENLPEILIYSAGEVVSVFHESPRTLKRELSLKIEIMARTDLRKDIDHKLDEISRDVENLLHSDDSLGGLVDDLQLAGVEYNAEPDGSSILGAQILTYNIKYLETAIEEGFDKQKTLNDLHIDYKVGHHGDEPVGRQIDATDDIDYEGL